MSILNPSGEGRNCKGGFLESYLFWTNPQESPEDYPLWNAVSIIGTALGRKCYVDRGFYKLYPNFYIVLVGDSALTHKSTCINMGTDVMLEAIEKKICMCSDTVTRAGLVEDLSERYQSVGISDIHIANSEFIELLGDTSRDKEFIPFLTALHDCKSRCSNKTIGRGKEVLHNCFGNLISGSTESWFRDALGEQHISGGFFSRLVPVPRSPSGKKNAHPHRTYTQEIKNAREDCVHDLQKIAELDGEFEWTPDAEDLYEAWYTDPDIAPETKPRDLWGYYGRKRDMVIKLAMIISSSFDDSQTIKESDLEYAMAILSGNERYMNTILRYLETTTEGAVTENVRVYIKKQGRIHRRKVLQNLSHSGISAEVLDNIINTIGSGTGSREVREINTKQGVIYEWAGEQ